MSNFHAPHNFFQMNQSVDLSFAMKTAGLPNSASTSGPRCIAMLAMRLALIAIFTSLFRNPAHGKELFDIWLKRYRNHECAGRSVSGPNVLRGNGKCRNWEDNTPFNNLTYAWAAHRAFYEKPEDHGSCVIRVWENDGCTGGF
ncbi:uncharacterized protein CLAFUR5_05161 [Fulvia fulva]|uniref:Uncharacterized protein n=1 Tax=Passalora fulva TaxID=5499 RepID=A0A9Q8P7J3_PASFU|nr:uncharacterized protein CLAFUR5_05161 [Fulvia fulva]KAK4616996.1 hypothetical protein CLAFUR0_10692 [Fulvia fulva]UJO16081.1 hypothetical protein CLAFUR5_05161 [Fulvia fulva]